MTTVARVSDRAAETPRWVATIMAGDASWRIRVNMWAPEELTDKAAPAAFCTGEGPDSPWRPVEYTTALAAMERLNAIFPGMWFVPRGTESRSFDAMVPA